MKKRWMLLFVLMIVSFKETPSQPASQIDLSLKISPLEAIVGIPATITAEVFNHGTTTSYRWEGCSYRKGMILKILDEHSKEVLLEDPRYRARCADGVAPFLAGERIKYVTKFDGRLFNGKGHRYEAQSGTYTAVIKYCVFPTRKIFGGDVIEQRISFQWRSQ